MYLSNDAYYRHDFNAHSLGGLLLQYNVRC